MKFCKPHRPAKDRSMAIGCFGEVAEVGHTHYYCYYTVVTLLLHCCHTVVTLLLQCYYTVVTLFLHYFYTVVTLLLHCCYTVHTHTPFRRWWASACRTTTRRCSRWCWRPAATRTSPYAILCSVMLVCRNSITQPFLSQVRGSP
jgi:hypothetical protein